VKPPRNPRGFFADSNFLRIRSPRRRGEEIHRGSFPAWGRWNQGRDGGSPRLCAAAVQGERERLPSFFDYRASFGAFAFWRFKNSELLCPRIPYPTSIGVRDAGFLPSWFPDEESSRRTRTLRRSSPGHLLCFDHFPAGKEVGLRSWGTKRCRVENSASSSSDVIG